MKRVRLYCTTSPEVGEAVEALLWSGLWGRNRAEVVERLVCRAILEVVEPADLRAIAQDVAKAEHVK